MPTLFFITALNRANLFHNLSCSVSHTLHVFLFCFSFLVYFYLVFNLFIFNPWLQFGLLPTRTRTKPFKGETETPILILIPQIFTNTSYSHEQRQFNIYLYAPTHSFLFLIPYLSCSTFFPHTKLPNTYTVYFHPQLYILFSVLSNYSNGFLIVHPGWLSASKVPL